MNNKKNIIYIVIAIVSMIASIGFTTYAYFASGVSENSINVVVETDTASSFSSSISKQLNIYADQNNMIKENNGWTITDTSQITIKLDAPINSSCYYTLTYTKEGDYYEPLEANNGGGLSLWVNTNGNDASNQNGENSLFYYNTETDYSLIKNTLGIGKITVKSGTHSEYTIDVNLKWTNLSSNQLANAGKTFNGILNVGSIVCDNDYTRLEYLESDGAQYIDTEFSPNQNSKMFLDYQPTKPQSTIYAGARNESISPKLYFTINSGLSNSKMYTSFGTKGNTTMESMTTDRVTTTIDKTGLYFNNKKVYSFSTVDNFSLNKSVFIFAVNQGATTTPALYASVKIYNCQLFDNNALVHDFIPMKRKSDNALGMYDTVSKKFYENLGSGNFTSEVELS